MELPVATQALFDLIDGELEYRARRIKNRVFSEYRELAWTPEQRQKLQPLLREELEKLITSILGIFDNVGGVIPDLPDGTIGYGIQNAYLPADAEEPDLEDKGAHVRYGEIRVGGEDYADMWWSYLAEKRSRTHPREMKRQS